MKVGDLVRHKRGLSGLGLMIEDNCGAQHYDDKEKYRRIMIMWCLNGKIDMKFAQDYEVVHEGR